MALPLKTDMHERALNAVAAYYRHTDILLYDNGVLVFGRKGVENEHVISIEITGPVKKEKGP